MLVTLQGHLGQFYLASGDVPEPIGSSHPINVPAGAYLASDGVYVQVHCTTPVFYEKLACLLATLVEGLQDLPSDSRFATTADCVKHRKELDAVLQSAFATKVSHEWSELFVEWDVTAPPINNIAQALADPQVQARRMVVEVERQVVGRYRTAGNPINLGQEERYEPPPLLGEHNEQVLRELLGCSDEEVRKLKEEGII